MVAGYRLQVAGYRLQVAGCSVMLQVTVAVAGYKGMADG
jgi:hypothetical protein